VAGLNAAGLVVYRLSRYWAERHLPSGTTSIWRIDPQRFWPRVLLLLAATGILQAAVYAKFGGIAGYIHTILDLQDAEAVQGMGWILTLCETFPAFAIMAWAVAARSQPWLRSWAAIAAMLVCFFAIQLLFGGLRGSRGNTIWGLVGAIGIVHLFVRPISRRMLAAGAVTGLIFLYFYGFIKGAGVEGLEAIYDSTSREEIARKTGRNMDMVLLGDLGRSDVQAFLVYRLSQGDNSFHYALGRSYFGAVASLVPSALWRDKPPTKVKEGTDAQWGEGAYESFGVRSSRQYGIAGEALLNFGIWSIPLAFAVLGFATAVVRRFMSRLVEGDARNFVVPLLSLSCVLLLVMDSENILLFLLKGVLIPLIALRAFAHVERDQASPVEVHG